MELLSELIINCGGYDTLEQLRDLLVEIGSSISGGHGLPIKLIPEDEEEEEIELDGVEDVSYTLYADEFLIDGDGSDVIESISTDESPGDYIRLKVLGSATCTINLLNLITDLMIIAKFNRTFLLIFDEKTEDERTYIWRGEDLQGITDVQVRNFIT